MRAVFALSAALLLGACTTPQVQAAHEIAEKADIAALDAYASIGLAVNTWEQAKPSDATRAEQLRSKAWADLMIVDAAYKAGQAIDLSGLTSDLNAAKAQ